MALQACRAAPVSTMEHSTVLAASATGGVLQSTVHQAPGTAPCSITMAVSAGPATIRKTGFLFVASGISQIAIGLDSFDNLIIYMPSVERILKQQHPII